jgi:hypothetical protein
MRVTGLLHVWDLTYAGRRIDKRRCQKLSPFRSLFGGRMCLFHLRLDTSDFAVVIVVFSRFGNVVTIPMNFPGHDSIRLLFEASDR